MGVAELPLRGSGGEPVDFTRTIVSHGVAELPPNRVDLTARVLETTLPVPRGARTVCITPRGKKLLIETVGGSFVPQLERTVAHMFRLDEDLPAFYTLVQDDELSWCGPRRWPHAARADGVRGCREDDVNAHTNFRAKVTLRRRERP
jgi:hypothetical protein